MKGARLAQLALAIVASGCASPFMRGYREMNAELAQPSACVRQYTCGALRAVSDWLLLHAGKPELSMYEQQLLEDGRRDVERMRALTREAARR